MHDTLAMILQFESLMFFIGGDICQFNCTSPTICPSVHAMAGIIDFVC